MTNFKVYILAFILCIPTLVWAQSYPSSQSLYVNDFANIIDAETKTRLIKTLKELKDTKGIEMTVVTINSVKDYASTQSIPDFTTGLFNAWGVGNATRNDGIVFLTSANDREMFIGLGSGYPPVYDDRMDRVFTYHVRPYFVKEDYAQGIEVGVLETIKRTSLNFVETPIEPNATKRLKDNIIHAFVIGFMAIAALFVFVRGFRKKFTDISYHWRPCPNCRHRSLTRERNITIPSTSVLYGTERVVITCSRCNFQSEKHLTLPRVSDNSDYTGSDSSRNGGSSRGGRGEGGSSGGGGGGGW